MFFFPPVPFLLVVVVVIVIVIVSGGRATPDYQHENCQSWSKIGECEKNPGYMLANCVASCKQQRRQQQRAHGDEETEEEEEFVSEHQQNLRNTKVEFTGVGVDLSADADTAAWNAITEITTDLHHRIATLYDKATTPECRALIGEHYGYFVKAIATERPLPFANIQFNNTCQDDENEIEWDFQNGNGGLPKGAGVHMGHVQNRTYQPPRNETEYFLSSSEIVLCYGILAHDNAAATIRFIEAVDEPTTMFVVHIDAKYEETYLALKEYAAKQRKDDRVTVLDHPHRVRVNWGGFSMVNATLQLLHYADNALNFTHFIHMASTAYPIASNRRIRNTLAAFPKDANFLHIILKPNRPNPNIWNYFVECDDRLHRIYRLPPITKETHGADFYTSSQWFIISQEFAHYLANPQPGSFLQQYLEYSPHTVVADESFFGTVLRNTAPFCNKHHNWNFLHLQFDRWENERKLELRDERKCVMPDPNHCGRSPITMTLDYLGTYTSYTYIYIYTCIYYDRSFVLLLAWIECILFALYLFRLEKCPIHVSQ